MDESAAKAMSIGITVQKEPGQVVPAAKVSPAGWPAWRVVENPTPPDPQPDDPIARFGGQRICQLADIDTNASWLAADGRDVKPYGP